MTVDRVADSKKAVAAELTIVVLLIGYGSFSVYRLVLLLLLASQSIWMRSISWSGLGLRRPPVVWHTLIHAAVAAFVVLLMTRMAIAPFSVWVTGHPIDHSMLVAPGDTHGLWIWLGQAWTLAAFAEEMVFRGYLISRVRDLFHDRDVGSSAAIVTSSILFGMAHAYQGWAGVIATTVLGGLMGLLYLLSRWNLWVVIICHGLVDTVALVAMYLGRHAWLFP